MSSYRTCAMTIFICHPLNLFPQLLNMFHFMKCMATPQPKGHTTVLSPHYIYIYSVFIFPHQLSAHHRILFLNWLKLSSGRWWRLVSSRYHNAPPTGSKVFSFKRVDFFHIYFLVIPLVSIDNPDDDIVTSSISIMLLLSYYATSAVFLWIQLNAISF